MRLICFILIVASISAANAETLKLVENGRTAYCIQHAADAPETARRAAHEVQRILQKATGAELRIVTNAAMSPAIRIVSQTSGPTSPPDGFEIRISGRDLVVTGNDQLAPSKPETWFVPSHGSLYGANEFLERFVGVRWLFPGELGEDVPHRSSLSVELNEPIQGSPSFAIRQVAYLGESDIGPSSLLKAKALEWMQRQRLTNSMHPHVASFGHSWDDYLTPADMAAHPEWTSTNGVAVRNNKVQYFCTTAPGLVDTFAARVIANIDRNLTRESTSISPTDGGGFCRCERCAKLLSMDPHGHPNHAAALLTFYQQVGTIIARERPHRRVGGFVYYNYQYPPPEPPALPENLALCWAPLNYYGYGLLKPVYREEFKDVMRRWSEIAPRLVYHNYSTWMRSFHGAPLPPSIEILKLELPTAAEHRVWGARMIGTTAWGANAPINYILSKQLWNARLDVSATLDEWLQRAYGSGGAHIRSVYDELDRRMLAHKAAQSPIYKGSQYEVNADVMRHVYVPLLPLIEQKYRAAMASCENSSQRQRLAMFGDNLVQLHFALRQAKLIESDSQSLFYRDETAFDEFQHRAETSISLHRHGRSIYRGPIWEGEWQAP